VEQLKAQLLAMNEHNLFLGNDDFACLLLASHHSDVAHPTHGMQTSQQQIQTVLLSGIKSR
jgi:hypothetical protein